MPRTPDHPNRVEAPEEGTKMQEAVLPHPLHTNMTSLPTSLPTSPCQDSQIIAGFQDCTEEVIRYLIEVENLPETHPVCEGLRQHLLEKQRLLNVETLLSNCQNQMFTESSVQRSLPVVSPAVDSSHQNAVKVSESSSVTQIVSMDSLPQPKMEHCSAFNLYDFFQQPSSIATTRSLHSDSRLQFIGQNDEDQSKTSPSDFRALDLQQLAENNPEIACLTEEILGLLEDDDDDMSVFDDSDSYFDSDIEQ